MTSSMPCHHFREGKVSGETKAVCTLCGQVCRRNSGIMTMHYRLMHYNIMSDVLINYFEPMQVDGVLKVVCTLCGRALRRNTHVMEVHYKMVHHPLTGEPRHVCSLQKQTSGHGNSDIRCNTKGTTTQAEKADERLQWIDGLAQRYPRICADPDVFRSMLCKAPPGARQILARWLMQRVKPLRDGVCLTPSHA
jgi:hypothetical protein